MMMFQKLVSLTSISLVIACLAITSGCRSSSRRSTESIAQQRSANQPSEYLHLERIEVSRTNHSEIPAPLTSLTELPDEFLELSLDEAIRLALQNTDILRSLGGTVVQNPQSAAGNYDPAIQGTDPIFGIEAALADFDANVNSSLLYAKNDQVFNNAVIGGGANEVRDDLATGAFNVNKTTATGTRFSLLNTVRHSETDNPNVVFPTAWTTVWEATARQPLLQGRGVRFNQIAGPNSQPGFPNGAGVVIARINHDISIAQFEQRLQTMVNEISIAYWRLFLAYRNFEAVKGLRDVGLTTWNVAKTRNDQELPGGEADREAQAREQYYQFEAQLLVALNGNRQTGQNGILQAEANLRRLLRLPQSGWRLIQPKDQPINAATIFDWPDLVSSTLRSRVEVRAQKSRVKQSQLEIEAAKNFLLPRLDAIATYRNNGFGDDLAFAGNRRFSSAARDAFSNDHGEWELGLTYDIALGMRQASASLRNAELSYCRALALLEEQEQQITHDLGSAVRSVEIGHKSIEIHYNRRQAALETTLARTAAFTADAVRLEDLLESQRRLLESELAYFNVVAEHEIAKEDLLNESGRLLREHGVNLSEEGECRSCDPVN